MRRKIDYETILVFLLALAVVLVLWYPFGQRMTQAPCYTVDFQTPTGSSHPLGTGPAGCYDTQEEAEQAGQEWIKRLVDQRLGEAFGN